MAAELPVVLCCLAALAVVLHWQYAHQARARMIVSSLSRHKSAVRRSGLAIAVDIVDRLVSPQLLTVEERRIAAADLNLQPQALIVIRVAVTAVFGCCLPLVCEFGVGHWRHGGVAASVGALLGLALSEWWLRDRTKHAQALLRRDWPGFLARIRLCLAAGMSLEAALECLVELCYGRSEGVVRHLRLVVARMQAGMPAERSLQLWADSCGVNEVAVFAGAVQRARAAGVALGPAIEEQERSARSRQRQAYLVWLNALPGRLSVVAMVFFLPAVLVIVLLPSVIAFLRAGW